ncbi:class I SAM-dependent methyltransferase [Streptomyces beigongshangae]|uniref:class I SAM-dependent methyltransferase n=1 Tax=Streptomyces beigongshangae TaxID=2841597 RepID=UPI001C841540|nr:class I SAM-dependent methyltransferase [Streptomyces sp. REN17]
MDETDPVGRQSALEGAYDSPQIATWYAARDDRMNQLLGHPFVFRALNLAGRRDEVLLDYGCGPAIVAGHAARHYAVRILAADVSPAMLAHARNHPIPHASYHRITDNHIPDLPDACADAAMCNHVLALLPDETTLLRAFQEIRRLLRPGAPFAALTTDPTHTGIRYTCQQIGDLGATYRPGDTLPVHLRCDDDTWQTFPNVYWPADIYPRLLQQAGFTRIGQHHPTVAEAEADPATDPTLLHSSTWTTERTHPPLLLTTARA